MAKPAEAVAAECLSEIIVATNLLLPVVRAIPSTAERRPQDVKYLISQAYNYLQAISHNAEILDV